MAVPVVELSLKPRSAKLLAKAATSALWASLPLMNVSTFDHTFVLFARRH